MRRLMIPLATGITALALHVPLAGAAAPARYPAPRNCPKDDRPMSMACRTQGDAMDRVDQLLAKAPGK